MPRKEGEHREEEKVRRAEVKKVRRCGFEIIHSIFVIVFNR
jgi:hypothetical protein